MILFNKYKIFSASLIQSFASLTLLFLLSPPCKDLQFHLYLLLAAAKSLGFLFQVAVLPAELLQQRCTTIDPAQESESQKPQMLYLQIPVLSQIMPVHLEIRMLIKM